MAVPVSGRGRRLNAARRRRWSSSRSSCCWRVYRHYGFDFRDYAHVVAAAAAARAVGRRGCRRSRALQERVLHDPALPGAAAARPVGQRQRDVPRPGLLPGVPAAGGAAAAHLPVHPHLARGLLDGRGGVLDGDPARRRRGCTTRCRIYATDINEVVLRAGARGHLPARRDAGVHGELHRRPAARGASPSTTRPRYDDAIFAPALRENIVFSQHNLVTDGVVQRVQRHPVPQRDDLLHTAAAGARARPVRAQPRHVRAARPRGRTSRCAYRRASTSTSRSSPAKSSSGGCTDGLELVVDRGVARRARGRVRDARPRCRRASRCRSSSCSTAARGARRRLSAIWQRAHDAARRARRKTRRRSSRGMSTWRPRTITC